MLVVHLHAAQGPFRRGTNSVRGVVRLHARRRSAGLVSADFASFPIDPRVKIQREKFREQFQVLNKGFRSDGDRQWRKNADPCCQGHSVDISEREMTPSGPASYPDVELDASNVGEACTPIRLRRLRVIYTGLSIAGPQVVFADPALNSFLIHVYVGYSTQIHQTNSGLSSYSG